MTVSRRALLASAATGGAVLAIGFTLRELVGGSHEISPAAHDFAPNLWLRIDGHGRVTMTVHKCEMGQGVLTALPMLIAEELEVDVTRVKVQQAGADFRVANQNTSGSSSIIESWEPLRRAGAVARVALVRAAAAQWGVAGTECAVVDGTVVHSASGRHAAYGELVARAAQAALPDPASIDLKPPWNFKVIGKPVVRHDAADKTCGRQRYGIDIRVPGMLFAAILRSRALSGRIATVTPEAAASLPAISLRSANLDAVRKLPGVRAAIVLDEDVPARLPPRIAIVADTTWHAFEAVRHVEAQWNDGEITQLSSESIAKRLRAAINESGEAGAAQQTLVVRNNGDALTRVAQGPAIKAEYELPYLAHASMEPINCTAHHRGESLEIWAPTQFPQRAVDHAARVTGLPREKITLHVIPMGGAFGRRASPDFVVEAVQVARAVGAPVQVLWTREQEIRQDFYRPASFQRLDATLNADGLPQAWYHRMAGPSVVHQAFAAGRFPIEANEIDAAVNVPYRIPDVRVEWCHVPIPVPLGVWRSVAQSQNLFAVESFIDELAIAAGHDTVDYRRRLVQGEPRLLNCLEIVARSANWRRRGQGVALNRYGDNTFIAVIAAVSVRGDGSWRVDRLTCAVDCGQPVNPLSLRAQIEGGLVWGLSAALHGRITIKEGGVEQSNFHDYPVLRMSEMPVLDIHIVDSQAAPGGIGEPCAPPVAPALANAIFSITGRRIRTQPFPERLAG